MDSANIDGTIENHSVVVTLSVDPHSLIIKPYYEIVQIKSDKTITEHAFRQLTGLITRLASCLYTDKIINGRTRTLSEDEYDTFIELLRNSDINSIQSEIDNAPPYLDLDGHSAYITVKDGDDFYTFGGHCAGSKDIRFRNLMDHILGLVE